jgi:hypothetical protein
MDNLALIGAEDSECADIAGCLAHHHIAGITEDTGEKIEALLRSDGNHHIVWMRRDVFQLHHVRDRFANGWLALA